MYRITFCSGSLNYTNEWLLLHQNTPLCRIPELLDTINMEAENAYHAGAASGDHYRPAHPERKQPDKLPSIGLVVNTLLSAATSSHDWQLNTQSNKDF